MKPLRGLRLIHDDFGGMTVEFVAIMPFFLLIVFFVIEVTLAMFWWSTAEKAVQLGVRVAVVSDPVTSGLPSVNAKAGSAVYGQQCGGSSDACTGFSTVTCGAGGAACANTAAFNRIVTRMQDIFGVIDASNVSVSYTYAGMGYAGGRPVPLVTVTLSGVQFRTGFISILGSLIGSGGALTTMPPISARLTGEDLSSSGS